ncbi:MAG: hypothetical protein ANABAC_2779 [Anaerolineae bacterium]|nr:MAG: hypothetical protein ANABAC_2779 [Anaerolineae bacterium]
MTQASKSHRYTLKFSGTIDEAFLADYCPAGTRLIPDEDTFVLSNLYSDQAGVLGILRYLHNYGCVLMELSITDE